MVCGSLRRRFGSAITGQCKEAAECLRCISHVMFCTVAGCMTAQVDYELKHRQADGAKSDYMAAPMQQPLMM